MSDKIYRIIKYIRIGESGEVWATWEDWATHISGKPLLLGFPKYNHVTLGNSQGNPHNMTELQMLQV